MDVRKFEASDYATISSWYISRNLRPMPLDLVPSVGFIVDNTAASFMYIADGKLALLEGSISNPNKPKAERQLALSMIFEHLILAAKALGLKRAYSVTRLPIIAEYAKTLGFAAKPGSITLVKDI